MLLQKFPPSEPCNCEICLAYCARPGWWTVEQAAKAIESGYASRIMLEISPEQDFCVLSPAFKGCESQLVNYSHILRGCTFLQNNLCELYGTGFQPLECRFCHHLRRGLGSQCHAALETEWKSDLGRGLVETWLSLHSSLKAPSLLVK
jgi:Fe-S-cluster containining protein